MWRRILTVLILCMIAEMLIVEEWMFFLFYEPEISPMSYWETRLEVVALLPVGMILYAWWVTFPLALGIATAVVKLRRLKQIGGTIRTNACRSTI